MKQVIFKDTDNDDNSDDSASRDMKGGKVRTTLRQLKFGFTIIRVKEVYEPVPYLY